MISTPREVVVQPLLVGTFAVRITKRKSIRILQHSAVTCQYAMKIETRENDSLQNTHIVVQVRRAPTI